MAIKIKVCNKIKKIIFYLINTQFILILLFNFFIELLIGYKTQENSWSHFICIQKFNRYFMLVKNIMKCKIVLTLID